MTVRVSMLLKSRASLTCFRACFFPGRAKDLSAPGAVCVVYLFKKIVKGFMLFFLKLLRAIIAAFEI